MTAPSNPPDERGWYGRFVEQLDPGERVGELLFGLIMVLTFTLGASVGLADRQTTRELLIAALGCNTAWGVIDAALYLMNRLSERGRSYRLLKAVQAAPNHRALELVERELDAQIPEIVGPEIRGALDQHVLERMRSAKLPPTRLHAADLRAALAVFWLVFATALPAVLPFLVIRDPRVAVRTSNAVLIALLFITGWRWAGYTGGSRWGTGLFMALLGVALVLVAIQLGG